MKTIFLLRHAKAIPDTHGVADFDRTLTEQGSKDARQLGRYIQTRQLKIDLVISSPANRARETARLVLQAVGLTADVHYDRRIYEADPQLMLDLVSELDSQYNSILLVGHNPAMEDFLRGLTGRSEPMPTSALAQIDSEVTEWTDLTLGKCVLKWLVAPEDLRSQAV